MAEGAIGKMYGIEVRFVEDQTRLTRPEYHQSWFADKNRAGGGHLTWLGIHWLDLSMYITGASITHVTGFATNIGGQPINIEDSAVLALRYENGALGTMTSGYYRKSDDESLIRIWGSEGWLELSSEDRRRVRWQNTARDNAPVEEFIGPADYVHYTAYTGACVRAAAGLGEAPMTPGECLRVLKAVYGLYEASASGRTIAI
jgi:predicted dehydrogenase